MPAGAKTQVDEIEVLGQRGRIGGWRGRQSAFLLAELSHWYTSMNRPRVGIFGSHRAQLARGESRRCRRRPAGLPSWNAWQWRVSGPTGASCAAGDPVEDGAEPEPELIVGELGRRGGRALGHGGDQAGEAFGVGQPQ